MANFFSTVTENIRTSDKNLPIKNGVEYYTGQEFLLLISLKKI